MLEESAGKNMASKSELETATALDDANEGTSGRLAGVCRVPEKEKLFPSDADACCCGEEEPNNEEIDEDAEGAKLNGDG